MRADVYKTIEETKGKKLIEPRRDLTAAQVFEILSHAKEGEGAENWKGIAIECIADGFIYGYAQGFRAGQAAKKKKTKGATK